MELDKAHQMHSSKRVNVFQMQITLLEFSERYLEKLFVSFPVAMLGYSFIRLNAE